MLSIFLYLFCKQNGSRWFEATERNQLATWVVSEQMWTWHRSCFGLFSHDTVIAFLNCLTPSCSERPKICKTLISPTCKTTRCFHTRNASYFQTDQTVGWLPFVICDWETPVPQCWNTKANWRPTGLHTRLVKWPRRKVIILALRHMVKTLRLYLHSTGLKAKGDGDSIKMLIYYTASQILELWKWWHDRCFNINHSARHFVYLYLHSCEAVRRQEEQKDLEILRIQQPNPLRWN